MPSTKAAKNRPSLSCTTVLRAAALRDRLLRSRRMLPACALLASAATLQGCIAVGGTNRHEAPTLGKQLVDLKTAYDGGALTEAEYTQAKAHILSNAQR
jgi:hypothetical protein